MKRIVTNIGDVFCAPLGNGRKKYLQYVANDLTQLNSSVVRVFKLSCELDVSPNLTQVVSGEIDFYVHVVLKWGIKMKLWEKVGNVPFEGPISVLFRNSSDYGNPAVKVSRNWYVWKTGEEHVRVGELLGPHRRAEIGVVINPASVVHRMKTGEYDFAYPGF